MNMHPGDRRSIEENEGADSAQKEKTTPIGHSRSSEMTKTPIHVEAEVGFSVGLLLLISRFRWVLFICAFGAVYAAEFVDRGTNRVLSLVSAIISPHAKWVNKADRTDRLSRFGSSTKAGVPAAPFVTH